jgi:branched-chain amino acid transport system permease protein
LNQAIQIVLGGLLQGSVYGLVALGFCLVFRVTGAINLAQGAFCVLGVLIAWTLQNNYGLPGLAALLVAALVVGLAGTAIGAVSFVPGLSRLGPGGLFILTAGLLTFLQGVMLVIWGSQPYALAPLSGERPVLIAGIRVPTQAFWILAAAVVVTVGLWWLLGRTRIGLALRACADNRFAAQIVGIDIRRMAILSFGLAAGIAAVAGTAVAPITSIDFSTSGLFTNFGFIAVAIGGLTSFVGSVLGGLLLGVASQMAAGYASSLFSNTIALSLLMIVLLWRPNGLFRRASRRLDLREEQHGISVILLDRGLRRVLACSGIVIAIAPLFLLSSSDLGALVIAWIIFIGVLGLDLLLGYAGQISLGQAGFMAVGGYVAGILSATYGYPTLPALLAGVLIAGLCGLALSAMTMRLRGTFLALATLAFGLMVDSLAVGLTDVTGGTSGLVGIPSLSLAGFSLSTPQRAYAFTGSLAVLLIIAIASALRTNFGRTLKAIRADQTAAAALGINVQRYKLLVGGLAAALGGLAGALYAFQFHFLSPDMVGTQRSFEMLAMLVVGGEGTLVGPLAGVLLLVFLPTLAQPLAIWMTAFEGLVLVVCMLWLPQGLFGTAMVRVAALRQVARDREAGDPERILRARSGTTAPNLVAGSTPPGQPALEVRSLGKRFGGLQAVSDVSFSAAVGTITAIIGPNGAGKSTLFNLMTGLYEPDSGEVRLFNRSLTGLASETIAQCGLVRSFQSARMFSGMSVRENVLVGAHMRCKQRFIGELLSSPATRRSEAMLTGQADALLALSGLSAYRDAEATALPIGAQKHVEVLRALMSRPRALLLDEPAAGLNDTETAELAELLDDIRAMGTTLVVVEHNMNFVMRLADRIVVLDAGSKVMEGPPHAVQRDERVIAAYIGPGLAT